MQKFKVKLFLEFKMAETSKVQLLEIVMNNDKDARLDPCHGGRSQRSENIITPQRGFYHSRATALWYSVPYHSTKETILKKWSDYQGVTLRTFTSQHELKNKKGYQADSFQQRLKLLERKRSLLQYDSESSITRQLRHGPSHQHPCLAKEPGTDTR